MHPLAIITGFAASIVAITTPAPVEVQTRETGCFDLSKVTCVGRQMNTTLAHEAINKACAQIPTCVSGSTVPTNPFLGKVPGYTATIILGSGKQCAGVSSWTPAVCASLFDNIINTPCAEQWPSSGYQLGRSRASCDDTFISLNFGG